MSSRAAKDKTCILTSAYITLILSELHKNCLNNLHRMNTNVIKKWMLLYIRSRLVRVTFSLCIALFFGQSRLVPIPKNRQTFCLQLRVIFITTDHLFNLFTPPSVSHTDSCLPCAQCTYMPASRVVSLWVMVMSGKKFDFIAL